jgi:hypothetical protein
VLGTVTPVPLVPICNAQAFYYAAFFYFVEEAYTQQGRAHIRRLHPGWAARPALMGRPAHAVESKAVVRIEVAVSPSGPWNPPGRPRRGPRDSRGRGRGVVANGKLQCGILDSKQGFYMRTWGVAVVSGLTAPPPPVPRPL